MVWLQSHCRRSRVVTSCMVIIVADIQAAASLAGRTTRREFDALVARDNALKVAGAKLRNGVGSAAAAVALGKDRPPPESP